MENSSKKVRKKCPICMNYLQVITLKNDTYKGNCPVCKAVVFSKEHSPKETHIKIIRNN